MNDGPSSRVVLLGLLASPAGPFEWSAGTYRPGHHMVRRVPTPPNTG